MKKFPNLFTGIGTLKNHQVKFFIDEEIEPVRQPPRPIPFHLRKKLERELEKMEEEGVIEPHHGPAPWISNLVLAPKDDGGIRVVVDMRCANRAIKQTNIPIPRAEEISSQLAGYKFFTKLDLKSAFHQLELDEESRILTVFHAGTRLMRYRRLTMGTAPASGELNKALAPLFQQIKHVFVIQDDLIVAGDTEKEHNETLHKVCKKIQESGMTLNPDKCLVLQRAIPWWGMIVSEEGLSPDPSKVEALKHMSRPATKDELKSFFCMIQSNKDFIENLTRKTTHMRKMLKKNATFKWNQKCQQEFEELKKSFTKDILLTHYDPRKKTTVYVDAHQTGLSAVLMQGEGNKERVVSTASRATTPTESRYPQLDLEALAIDFALRRYRFYLAGGPTVDVITDHKPLESIFKNIRTGSIRTERIKLRHQDLNYKVRWEKGETNSADYLSRHAIPLRNITKEIREETQELEKTIWLLNYSPFTEAITVERLVKATKKDPILEKLKESINKGYLAKREKTLNPFAKIFNQLTISDSGLVMKEERIILPETLIQKAIEKAHQGGHPGMTSMKRRLRTHFWFPKMNERIEHAVNGCISCAMFTPKNRKNQLYPHDLQKHNAWEKVSIDLFGPMPNQEHIIVAQDMMSKFPAAKILKRTDAEHVTAALEEFYTSYGTPIVHRTDNGPPFNSEKFAGYSKEKGIHHEKAFPYHPQANPVECFMKPMGKCMKAAHAEGENKSKALNSFLARYRATPHSSTGIAPGDILFRHGYGQDFPKNAIPDDQAINAGLKRSQEHRERLDKEINSTRHDDHYEIGEEVFTKNNNRTKFEPMYGPNPMTVTETGKGGVTCRGKDGTIQRRHKDDIKLAPAAALHQEEANPEQGTPREPAQNPRLPPQREPAHNPGSSSGSREPDQYPRPELEHRRSGRKRKENPKFKDYILE